MGFERDFSQCAADRIMHFDFAIALQLLNTFGMSLAIEQPQPVPLDAGPDGIIRLRGTRVTLESVVEAFQEGSTPEEIAQQYPTLSLADIYSVLGYYLGHQQAVAAYLR